MFEYSICNKYSFEIFHIWINPYDIEFYYVPINHTIVAIYETVIAPRIYESAADISLTFVKMKDKHKQLKSQPEIREKIFVL